MQDPVGADHVHPNRHPHHEHPHVGPVFDRRTLLRSGAVGLGAMLLAACGSSDSNSAASGESTATADTVGTGRTTTETVASGETLAGFEAFADTVQAFIPGDVWLIESNGLPTHQMMVGITSWQQQFPVAQPSTGSRSTARSNRTAACSNRSMSTTATSDPMAIPLPRHHELPLHQRWPGRRGVGLRPGRSATGHPQLPTCW